MYLSWSQIQMLVSYGLQPQFQHLEPKKCCLWLNHNFGVNDEDLFGCLWPFVSTMACSGKRESFQVFMCLLTCRGQFMKWWKWHVTAFGGPNIYIYIHSVAVIVDFSSKRSGKNTNLRADRLPCDFSCWRTHQCWAKIPFFFPSILALTQILWWERLIGMSAVSFKGPLSSLCSKKQQREKKKGDKTNSKKEQRNREKETKENRRRKRHKTRQIIGWWSRKLDLQELQCCTVSVCSKHGAITKILLCRL